MFNMIFSKKRVSTCLSLKKQLLFSSLYWSFKKQLLQTSFSKKKITNFFLEKKVRKNRREQAITNMNLPINLLMK